MKIDKNDAPEGAIAVDATSICDDCMYFSDNGGCSKPVGVCSCAYLQRRDGHDVIFKPAPKAYKRDSNGRFTSAQSERRKTMNREYMEKHFPEYAEAQKAMTGETITQAMSKKQAEIESNTKHVQTNAEKYAKDRAEDVVCRWKAEENDSFYDNSIHAFLRWMKYPAAQDWPEWCKVGSWIAWNTGSKTVFRKIESVEAVLCLNMGVITRSMMDEGGYFPARVRPFTAKEAVDLVGKTVVQTASERFLKIESIVLNYGEDVQFSLFGKIDPLHVYSDEIASYFTFENGSPCGVLEVIK